MSESDTMSSHDMELMDQGVMARLDGDLRPADISKTRAATQELDQDFSFGMESNISAFWGATAGLSELQYLPRGLDVPALVLNSIVFKLHSCIPGPFTIRDWVRSTKYLGEGAQFEVFGVKALLESDFSNFDGPYHGHRQSGGGASANGKQLDTGLIAVKRAKLVSCHSDDGEITSVTTRTGDQSPVSQLYVTYFEILSLCRDELRSHPNVVTLLAWGYDAEGQDDSIRSPVLFLERATGSAAKICQSLELPWEVKKYVCEGTVSGIKALHGLRIVHGDVKPENVLIYASSNSKFGCLAKIADFGSTWEPWGDSQDMRLNPRGTPGWAAPEIPVEDMASAESLKRLDIWSLALTTWSILLERGRQIQRTAPQTYAAALSHALIQAPDLGGKLGIALKDMLVEDPSERTASVEPLRCALQVPEMRYMYVIFSIFNI